ncbi:MAG: thiol-disulfide oxidoreductase DCC family protein, partial [Mycobacteriales bacterium]
QLGAAELAALGLSRAQVEEAVWWIDEQGRSTSGADAVARALIATGGWRALVGRIGLLRPLRPATAAAYRVLARYRHRLPGSTPACRTSGAPRGRPARRGG